MSFKIRILAPGPRTFEAEAGLPLSTALIEAGFPLNAYCGGKGLCGRCLVEVIEGQPLPPGEAELALLTRAGRAAPGVRLACLLPVRCDLAVRIPPESLLGETQGLTEGLIPAFAFDPPVKRYALDAESGPSSPPLPEVLRQAALTPGACHATVFEDGLLLEIASRESPGPPFGLAVDLGTTTVAAELIDLDRGRIAAKAVALNGQARFGADLIARIAHAVQAPGGAEALRRAALETLAALQARVCAEAGVAPDAVFDVVVAGNTVMNHLLLGRSVRSLAEAPFEASFLSLPPLEAAAHGLGVHRRARLFVAPNIGSYIGGDITAGLVATGLLGMKGNALFVDLGTNGEIVLKAGGSILAASTAAGPAFEGAGLSCGMLAVPGAVDGAVWSDGASVLSVIGGLPAAGICGTGYIDLLALFLRRGLVSPGGVLLAPGGAIAVAPGVSVSRKDVRELQLAVAAVRTGVALLLRRRGLAPSDLDAVILAGAFGSTLDVANGRRIGLLPEVDAARVRFAGNASLAGARAMLLSRSARVEAAAIAGRIEHVPLASDPAFQDTYIRSLAFPGNEADA